MRRSRLGHLSLLKKFGVGSNSNEFNTFVINLIDQQKISADMAFPAILPFPTERMIQPLRAKRRIIGDER